MDLLDVLLQKPIPDESRAIFSRVAERLFQSVDLAIGIETAKAPFVPTVSSSEGEMAVPARFTGSDGN